MGMTAHAAGNPSSYRAWRNCAVCQWGGRLDLYERFVIVTAELEGGEAEM